MYMSAVPLRFGSTLDSRDDDPFVFEHGERLSTSNKELQLATLSRIAEFENLKTVLTQIVVLFHDYCLFFFGRKSRSSEIRKRLMVVM